MMKRSAKVQVFQDVYGGWRWRLVASNGEIVAYGPGRNDGYTRQRDCIRAVDRALRLAAGQFCRTDNGQRIG